MPISNKRGKSRASISNQEQRVSLYNRRVGHLTLDVTKSEQHGSQLKITENPVEFGASVTDHSMVTPISISISGLVVDYDSEQEAFSNTASPTIRGNKDFVNDVSIPGLKNRTDYAEKLCQKRIKKNASLNNDSAKEAKHAITPWSPDNSQAWLKDRSVKSNRIERIYDDFLALQKLGQTIEITTGIKHYKNMLIESLSVSQSSEGFADFSITAREVFIVQSKVINGVGIILKNEKQLSGRAASQGCAKTSVGSVAPK
ncbi:phage baseplate protein [Pragia fontium]|uniref:Dit-like phage tail protein N-terminal domain-containing protein n=1 Tax=Pragia fontium DSM 5563 = ATCC 49100 TaxID=1122977 RepID=A0AAJ4WAS9_9GAMM|nr:hypothetical protein [Pragia fontium]SFC86219.1 hypothetical protein SAMN02745723_10519 [Pragia fontium DSM 5563 = ATCC 49100]SUB83216.1 Uncharacterised protein [Pragia fontium]VEJ56111.1 Uncharacterised protein [Pragia fontium]